MELAADAMAERVVMRKSADGNCASAPSDSDPLAIEDEQPRDGATMMAKSTGSESVSSGPHEATDALIPHSLGAPLPPAVRSFMEPRFGHNFGAVRVHADGRADALSRSIHAEAFTAGSDIYFRAGRFEPTTFAGRRLLAHELTHVVQQGDEPTDMLHRFTLSGFAPADDASMRTAIPLSSSTVRSKKPNATCVASAIDNKTYNFDPNLDACGWTFPLSGTIKIGPSAFQQNQCCDLASTIAHEASHTCLYVESGARKLECDCFGCSCS